MRVEEIREMTNEENQEKAYEVTYEVPRVVWRLERRFLEKGRYDLVGIYSTRQKALDEAGDKGDYVVRGTVLDEPIMCLAREGVYRIGDQKNDE